jgi:hypothetical protein
LIFPHVLCGKPFNPLFYDTQERQRRVPRISLRGIARRAIPSRLTAVTFQYKVAALEEGRIASRSLTGLAPALGLRAGCDGVVILSLFTQR